jgi:hypothetical protein
MPFETPRELQEARDHIATLIEHRARVVEGPVDRGRRGEIVRIDRALGDLIGRLQPRVDPCDASPMVPLVLLPVRVQTKLAADGRTLRVKITPDEVHLDTLTRTLTDDERAAGRAYWTTLWMDDASASAWPALLEAVGPRRAGWVARAMTPIHAGEPDDDVPRFPDAPREVARGSVARCLPDQFVVRVYPAGGEPITVVGGPIAPDLPISPIAFDDEEELIAAGGLFVPAGSEWTVDFDHAVAAGLGVTVTLAAGTRVLERVVVVGTRRSVPEEQNARELEDLLTSHRYTDGLSLLAAGTPTNNADAGRSPYRPTEGAPAPAFPPASPSADATNLANLLGLMPESIERLVDALAPRSSLDMAQRAANTALWYATWQPALERIEGVDVAGVTPGSVESARRVHRDAVRGAGHAPTLRLGAQPYGVLPVTDLSTWRPRTGEITAALVPLVRRTLARWRQRAARLPHVRPGDQVSDEDLLEIMGTSPIATGVRARPVVDGRSRGVLASATGYDDARLTAELQVARAVLAQYAVDAARHLSPPALHSESRRIALPLVSDRDPEVIEQVLADATPRVDSVLQALLIVAWGEAKSAGLQAAPETHVGPLAGLLGLDAATAAVLKEAAVPTAAAPRPEEVFALADRLRSVVHIDDQPTEQLSLAAFEPVAEARTSLAHLALDLGDTPQARFVGSQAVAGLLSAFAVRGEVKRAMTALASVPLEERRIAVASALDVASHRVDAWATAIAASRTRPGVGAATVGAFGYVEDVRLGPAPRGSEGWLQAPSSSHAVAAGLLASAHRSKIGAKSGQEPFAIDLSSRRGSELRRILEGVHAGQSIGALIGYQIERALTGSAARFQLSLRELAPLTPDELDNDLAEADRSTRVAAAAVVDGAALLRRFPMAADGSASAALRQALNTQPKNAYIELWKDVSNDEWRIVTTALQRAEQTLDAVADALLSESVLQYASGNAARASAALDAMGSGGAVDPELGVLGVRQAGQTLTHQVLTAIPVGATGWSASRPRAVAEPRLEAWAARRLGDPAAIVVADGPAGRHTLAEAGWAALDLVFADDVASLDRDLRAAIPAIGDLPLAESPAGDWPAGSISILAAATLASSMRVLAAGSTPLLPSDLVRPGVQPQRTLDTDELLARCEDLLAALEEVLVAGEPAIAGIDPETLAVPEEAVEAVRGAVAGLAAFGVPLVPDPKVPTAVGWAWGAWQAAAARLDHARAALADALAPHDPPRTTDEILDAANAIAAGTLGDGFRMLPLLVPGPGADDFVQALGSPSFAQPAVSAVNAFVRDHATVRAGVAGLAEAQLIGRALGRPVTLTVLQLTEREGGVPAPGTDRWLAGPLPDDLPWPEHSAAHLVADLTAPAAEYGGRFAGISFDGWPEALPFQPDHRAFGEGVPDNPVRGARATTGLAVQAHQSSARAPQVILSAVSPDGARWTTDSVIRTVVGAVDLAKARMVTLEHVPGDAAVLPAIYVASPWLQARRGLYFDALAAVPWTSVAYPFLSEVK